MAKIKDEIHVDDIGTKIRVTIVEGVTNPVAVDITGYTSIDFIFEKPDKTQITRTASVESAANGIVFYTTISGDLDQPGRWRMQLDMTLPAWDGKSDLGEFLVYENL
jgi:hypothetical protein